MHRTTARFWTSLARLPEPIPRVAHQNFELLRKNSAHPSLHFKKIGIFGPRGSGSITAPSPSRMERTLFGSGSALMTSISG